MKQHQKLQEKSLTSLSQFILVTPDLSEETLKSREVGNDIFPALTVDTTQLSNFILPSYFSK